MGPLRSLSRVASDGGLQQRQCPLDPPGVPRFLPPTQAEQPLYLGIGLIVRPPLVEGVAFDLALNQGWPQLVQARREPHIADQEHVRGRLDVSPQFDAEGLQRSPSVGRFLATVAPQERAASSLPTGSASAR